MRAAEQTRQFRAPGRRPEPVGFFLTALLILIFSLTVLGQEVTKTEAIGKVKGIINRSAATCGIETRSMTATRVKAGWRVTALIWLSASGVRRSEKAIWIVSRAHGASPQDQLTFEIADGCH